MLCQNRVLNTSLISVKTCTRIQYLYKNAFYALQKSRFEYESVPVKTCLRKQYMYLHETEFCRNDHTMVTAPLPVCSAKLSTIGPGQYYGGGPRWNTRCCSFAKMPFMFFKIACDSELDIFQQNCLLCSSKIACESELEIFWQKCLLCSSKIACESELDIFY